MQSLWKMWRLTRGGCIRDGMLPALPGGLLFDCIPLQQLQPTGVQAHCTCTCPSAMLLTMHDEAGILHPRSAGATDRQSTCSSNPHHESCPSWLRHSRQVSCHVAPVANRPSCSSWQSVSARPRIQFFLAFMRNKCVLSGSSDSTGCASSGKTVECPAHEDASLVMHIILAQAIPDPHPGSCCRTAGAGPAHVLCRCLLTPAAGRGERQATAVRLSGMPGTRLPPPPLHGPPQR